jgi:hypothetical protein
MVSSFSSRICSARREGRLFLYSSSRIRSRLGAKVTRAALSGRGGFEKHACVLLIAKCTIRFRRYAHTFGHDMRSN